MLYEVITESGAKRLAALRCQVHEPIENVVAYECARAHGDFRAQLGRMQGRDRGSYR